MTPVLWSFRRCPYAMRARLAIHAAGVPVTLREILLRDKPAAFLAASPSATVPCLQADTIIDESRDIMLWALRQSDPLGWLTTDADPLIDACDGPFKTALDQTKYNVRYPDIPLEDARSRASDWLMTLNDRLALTPYLLGERMSLADAAILPFVRQFAHIDRPWFDAQDWPHLIRWLDAFLDSPAFAAIMVKYPPWQPGQDAFTFP